MLKVGASYMKRTCRFHPTCRDLARVALCIALVQCSQVRENKTYILESQEKYEEEKKHPPNTIQVNKTKS